MEEVGQVRQGGAFAAPGNFVFAHRIRVSRVLLLAFIAALLACGSRYEGTLLPRVLLLAGIVLAGIATVGRIWCALYISGHKDADLVTSGPYSLCRNPLYLFTLLGMAGLGLTTGTLTLALVFPAAFIPGYLAVVRREELALHQRFRGRFEAYCAGTPRFLPRLATAQEPVSYVVSPPAFRRALRDVIWFVWAIGVVQLFVALHELHLADPLLRLP